MSEALPPTNHNSSPESEPQGMQAIIVGPEGNGEGVYALIAEDGEVLAQHFCSDASFAKDDLSGNRERQEKLNRKGITSLVWLHESGLTWEEIVKRNHDFHEGHKEAHE